MSLTDALAHERRLFYLLFASDDQKEGMAAFLEKRNARLHGPLMAETGPSFPTEGDSALLVDVAEAEPVVGHLRLVHDAVAAHGIPAHVTVLYPFVPRTPDARGPAGDSAAFGAIPAFDYRFDQSFAWARQRSASRRPGRRFARLTLQSTLDGPRIHRTAGCTMSSSRT